MFHANNRTVNVSRGKLLQALREGREKHVAEHAQAMADYRDAAEKYLTEALERVKSGDLSDIRFSLPRPECHAEDYDEVIAMLEFSVDTELSLDANSFRSYVLGEWSWKKTLEAATSSIREYLSK